MRNRWEMPIALLRRPRVRRRLTAALLCMLLTAPLHGFAEASLLPEHMRVRALHPTPTPSPPEAAPAPTPTPTPVPTPAPTPPEEGDYCFLGHRTQSAPLDMAGYYLEEMVHAAADGDARAGRAAEEARDAALRAGGEGTPLRFDDLLLLARLIDAMAGSDWLSDAFRMCVGEVVLNRVASPEFPDTLREVLWQRGQYAVVNTARFASLVPRQECVDAALRLLCGERRMVPAVVYQSDYLQGELFAMFSDRRLGNTYFCLSEHLELYP